MPPKDIPETWLKKNDSGVFHGKANLIEQKRNGCFSTQVCSSPSSLGPGIFLSTGHALTSVSSCLRHEEPCQRFSLTLFLHFALIASSFLPQRPILIFISGASQNVGSRKVPPKLSMSKIDEFCLRGLSFHERLKSQLLHIHNNAFSRDCTMRHSMICGLRKPTQESLQATQANPMIS